MADKRQSPFITSGERVRNFLLAAFGLSLLLHLVAIPFFPTLGAHKEDQTVEKVSVTKKTKIKVPTPPPPTPTPRPTPTPQAHSTPPPKTQLQPQPKLKLNVPKTTSNNSSSSNSQSKYVAPKSGSQNGVPNGQGTAAPKVVAPVATAAPTEAPPACRTPYQDATAPNQVPPDYPEAARSLGLGPVTVLVQVTISPTGSLQSAKIYQSSNNMSIDQSALSAARQSSYSPKIVACKPVEGTYLFRAQFDPNQ